MKKLALLFLLLLSFMISIQSVGQNKGLSAKVLKQLDTAETDMVNAISNGDSAAFKKIAGYDCIDISADGIKSELKLR